MCEYCKEKNNYISGKTIFTSDWKETAGYHETTNNNLNAFILKCRKDEKAGLMIENIDGARYIDINYCFMCGRKLYDNSKSR